MTPRERIARFARLSRSLATLSGPRLRRLVEDAVPLGRGIGGTTSAIEVDGCKVFVKRLRLTDLERRPEHRGSTANLFGLPTFCQRNVGSAGFGVWREWAAHAMTTDWVLSGRLETFPMMYHGRVLEDDAAGPLIDELADVQAQVAHWGGTAAMRLRLEALATATASVVIFLEHLPWTLSAWLEQQFAAGPEATDSALRAVERGLTVDVASMNALGLLHGDAHFGNILTDGHRLYFADFGLATSARFALSPDEAHYLRENATLDRAYVLAKWVNALVKAFAPAGSDVLERMAWVRAVAQGGSATARVPASPAAAAIIGRHAPVAAVMNAFYAELHGPRRTAPYPREAVDAALQAAAGP